MNIEIESTGRDIIGDNSLPEKKEIAEDADLMDATIESMNDAPGRHVQFERFDAEMNEMDEMDERNEFPSSMMGEQYTGSNNGI